MIRSSSRATGTLGESLRMRSFLWHRWMTRFPFKIFLHHLCTRRLRGDNELSAERMIAVPAYPLTDELVSWETFLSHGVSL